MSIKDSKKCATSYNAEFCVASGHNFGMNLEYSFCKQHAEKEFCIAILEGASSSREDILF